MNNCRFLETCIAFFPEVHAYGVFSNFLAVSQKESSTLLQLREILLRTVGCTGVLLSLSIARKYSILQQTGGDTSFLPRCT